LKVIHVYPESEVSQEAHEKRLKKTLSQMIDVISFEGDRDFDCGASL